MKLRLEETIWKNKIGERRRKIKEEEIDKGGETLKEEEKEKKENIRKMEEEEMEKGAENSRNSRKNKLRNEEKN